MFEEFSDDFLRSQKEWLLYRLKTKKKILDAGGPRAVGHSFRDITRIEFALKRIEQKQYGLCCDCGCPIEFGRLEFTPETPFCAFCAKARNIHKHAHN